MSITTVITILLALLTLPAYRMGLRDGRAAAQGRDLEPVIRRRSKSDRSGSRYSRILSNVERYNGSSKGQKEIEK